MLELRKGIFNTFIIYLSQIVNIAFPIIVLPKLSHNLSLTEFSSFLSSQSLYLYVFGLIEYGFNLSATRALINNPHSEGKLIININSAKTIMSIITFLILLVGLVFIGYVKLHFYSLLIGIIGGTFYGFFPTWWYQAHGKFHFAAMADFVSRITGIGLIMLMPSRIISDFAALLCISLPTIFACVTLYILDKKLRSNAGKFSLMGGINELKKGSTIFSIRLIGLTYTTGLGFITSVILPQYQSSRFIIVDRVVKGSIQPIAAISQSFYPIILKSDNLNLVKYLFFIAVSYSIFIVLLLNFFGRNMISFLSPNYSDSFTWCLMNLASLSVIPIAINTLLVSLYLIPKGREDIVQKVIIFSGLVNFCGLFVSYFTSIHFLVIASILAEVLAMAVYINFIRGSKNGQ